jgi:hypothetical protein
VVLNINGSGHSRKSLVLPPPPSSPRKKKEAEISHDQLSWRLTKVGIMRLIYLADARGRCKDKVGLEESWVFQWSS